MSQPIWGSSGVAKELSGGGLIGYLRFTPTTLSCWSVIMPRVPKNKQQKRTASIAGCAAFRVQSRIQKEVREVPGKTFSTGCICN